VLDDFDELVAVPSSGLSPVKARGNGIPVIANWALAAGVNSLAPGAAPGEGGTMSSSSGPEVGAQVDIWITRMSRRGNGKGGCGNSQRLDFH